ncbi:hypothetical protein CEXT_459501 [Caerostris extrusa]|uniref:Uncharacterized protein n=1 Tax=Caerostris extrusa TaxID=172846 RepID=A0AAV4PVY2_CAEEX|nr:hypothetical protein CEXT_459501 [Caerostris extrusa]
MAVLKLGIGYKDSYKSAVKAIAFVWRYTENDETCTSCDITKTVSQSLPDSTYERKFVPNAPNVFTIVLVKIYFHPRPQLLNFFAQRSFLFDTFFYLGVTQAKQIL